MKKVLKVVAVIVAALVLLLGYGVYLSLTKELNGDLVLVGFKEVEWDEKLNGQSYSYSFVWKKGSFVDWQSGPSFFRLLFADSKF